MNAVVSVPATVIVFVHDPELARQEGEEAELPEHGPAAVDHRAEDPEQHDEHEEGAAIGRALEEPIDGGERGGRADDMGRPLDDGLLRQRGHPPLAALSRAATTAVQQPQLPLAAKRGLPSLPLISFDQTWRTWSEALSGSGT